MRTDRIIHIFEDGDDEKINKITPPCAMLQARGMERSVHFLKIFLLQLYFRMSLKDERALQDVCSFIVNAYLKPWLECDKYINSRYGFWSFDKIEKFFSKAAWGKCCQHLRYLFEEKVISSLFDNEVDEQSIR